MDLDWQKISTFRPKDYKHWVSHQIFHNRLIFLHIWKTGGSSMKTFFKSEKNSCTASHQMCFQIINQIGMERYLKYTSFTVVRNPYDRLVSIYFYNKQWMKIRTLNSDSFEEFVKSGEFKKFPPMYYTLTYKGKIFCNYILKLENITNDLEKMLKELKINKCIKSFPKVRSSKHKNYLEYYKDREIINIVNEYYKKDFELFNYELM